MHFFIIAVELSFLTGHFFLQKEMCPKAQKASEMCSLHSHLVSRISCVDILK